MKKLLKTPKKYYWVIQLTGVAGVALYCFADTTWLVLALSIALWIVGSILGTEITLSVEGEDVEESNPLNKEK